MTLLRYYPHLILPKVPCQILKQKTANESHIGNITDDTINGVASLLYMESLQQVCDSGNNDPMSIVSISIYINKPWLRESASDSKRLLSFH